MRAQLFKALKIFCTNLESCNYILLNTSFSCHFGLEFSIIFILWSHFYLYVDIATLFKLPQDGSQEPNPTWHIFRKPNFFSKSNYRVWDSPLNDEGLSNGVTFDQIWYHYEGANKDLVQKRPQNSVVKFDTQCLVPFCLVQLWVCFGMLMMSAFR